MNLKLTQIQAGCYPCPNMMTIWGLCDRELGVGEKCSEEETELTQEKMWEFSTELTNEIANSISEYLNPKGVAVVINGEHLCMRMRGVQKQNATMQTSSMTGIFMKDDKTREEFLNLIS